MARAASPRPGAAAGSLRRVVTSAVACVAAGQLLPSVAAIGLLRRSVLPGLSGQVSGRHVGLSFDDGPDPDSTPQFLDLLARLDVRATFFVLGSQLTRHPEVARRMVADGHEVAVHGWTHRVHLLRAPRQVRADVERTVDCVIARTGVAPRHWRPPYGIPTGAGLLAARRCRLRPVLWTADGQDWQAGATPGSVRARVARTLRGGGTVLLHDADTTCAPEAWRATLAALPPMIQDWRDRGWAVGPLTDHWQPVPGGARVAG